MPRFERPTGYEMNVQTRALLIGFALLGLVASSTSSYVHYQLLSNPSYASFCDVNPAVSCTQAYLSRYGSIFGVPVALAGVAFFTVVLCIAGAAGRPGLRRENAAGHLFALSAIGLVFVLYLAWASYVELRTFCILCALTYVAVIGIFVVALTQPKPPLATLPRHAASDLASFLGTPLRLLLTLGAIVVAGTIVSLFPDERATPVQAAAYPALTDQQKADLEKWWNLQPVVDLPIANEGATIVVVKFSDFMCPACRQSYEWYRPMVAKYEPGGKVRFVVKHYPLEAECNTHAPSNHYASCEAAAAVVMARPAGKAAELEQWLFSNQATLTPQTVKAAAREVAGIQNFDEQYPAGVEEVRADANLGGTLGVNRTPTFYIAGRKLPNESILPPQYFDYLIELALKTAK